ncbi:type III secretion system export apparatus subunit SctS [Halodesulfovibrio spirochaetisodalis]|uniref:Type III secretion protein HrpO n=1 Tax=Halodesulfovibrio spirochaetisodalis TaxID=1560234 RepID=A0A1B7X9C1_9BACT|nr:type III secretion system export apparatus subunit SctS [Halodesulfovibrio spirochaetisodalis]OBQ45961.1 type III secretion protein HrpO [Halodesulfovibrio spirochaetisodalis]
MGSQSVIDFAAQALLLVLQISMPPIIVASIAGVLLSLVQAITQIQEQTLSFGIKLICVCATLFLAAGTFGKALYVYSLQIFDSFNMIVR